MRLTYDVRGSGELGLLTVPGLLGGRHVGGGRGCEFEFECSNLAGDLVAVLSFLLEPMGGTVTMQPPRNNTPPTPSPFPSPCSFCTYSISEIALLCPALHAWHACGRNEQQ